MRQLVHVAMGGFAFALRALTWKQAAACATAALIVNLVVLPKLARHLFRDGEIERRFPGGIVFYPLSVLLLIVTFPNRLDIAAAAWAILAVGDGLATLSGRAIGGPRLPWNRDKTWAGTVTFIIAGALAATALGWWMRPVVDPSPPAWFLWSAPWIAAAVAGLVESMPVGLDDNLSVPAAAAAAAWAVSMFSPAAAVATWPLVWSRLWMALAVNALAAWAGARAGTVSRAGALTGFAIGVAVWLGAGERGWLVLLASFLLAVIASRTGLKRKMVLGIAEAREGRRGPGNALANCGLAAVAALLTVWSTSPALGLLAFVTALASGASDTVASEIGKGFGRRTLLVTTLRHVPPGTPGALSLEGTAAGITSAFGLGLLASSGLGLIPAGWLWIVVAASTLGSLTESILGASFEPAGVLNNDLLNFLNTAVAALAASVFARSFM